LATRIQIEENGKNTLDIYLGRTKYHPPSNSYSQYGNNNYTGSTFVRLAGSSTIYEVDGFLVMMFNKDFNEWRKNDFITTDKTAITQLQFQFPDNDYAIINNDSVWSIKNEMVDSTKMEQYLSLLTNKVITRFSDHYSPSKEPEYSLNIGGNNMNNINIKCYQDSLSGEYIMKSSLNPTVYFQVDSTGLFKQLFVPKDYFLRSE
jgi:hypothetical protein